MDLAKAVAQLLVEYSSQHDDWDSVSDAPTPIHKVDNDESLPFGADIVQKEDGVSLHMHLFRAENLRNVAHAIVNKNGGEPYTNSDGPFETRIDHDGFSVFCHVTEDSLSEFTSNFDAIINRCENLLQSAVKQAIELVSESSKPEQESEDESEETATPVVEDTPSVTYSPREAVVHFLEEKNWKYRDNSDNQYIEFGMNLDKYSDHDSKSLLLININYGNKDLIRFQTPMMYRFDLRTTPYSLIASVIAWYQFEYKFLAMSLDPSDGELKISIDIPLGDGVIHPTQVGRIITFMIQFSEETYEEMFDDLLHSPEKAQESINEKIEEYQQKIETKKWVRQFENDLVGLSEAKRHELEKVLQALKASDEGANDTEFDPTEGI